MTRVRARIVIDHDSASERTFSCVGQAGNRKTYASTIVYPAGASDERAVDAPNTKHLGSLKPARILHYYDTVFEVIGSNLILPCRSSGRPKAEVYWMDEESNVIGDQEPRYKTLPTGELIITSLRWSDMGLYTCVAKNAIAKDTITTFIYPMKAND
jgi:Immunoglobulin domain